METLTLTFSEANKAASDLESLKANFDQEVKNMQDTYSRLSNMWEGAAKDRFTEQLRADKEKFMNFSRLIGEYATTLREDVNQYMNTEQKNCEIASTRTS